VITSIELIFGEVQLVDCLDSSNQMLHGLLGHVLRNICLVHNFLQGVLMGLETQERDMRDILARVFFSCYTTLYSLCFITVVTLFWIPIKKMRKYKKNIKKIFKRNLKNNRSEKMMLECRKKAKIG